MIDRTSSHAPWPQSWNDFSLPLSHRIHPSSAAAAVLLTIAVGFTHAMALAGTVKVLYRKGDDIFTLQPGGQPRLITANGIAKYKALWSKDGRKIAFLQMISKSVALDNLLVADPDTGAALADIRICPTTSSNECLIRYVERIEWLTADKIATSGSVNPSTVLTTVFDARTGNTLADYQDDDGGAVFSPDGEHAATESGSPHFGSDADNDPELDIDNERVYPIQGTRSRFLSKPAWSERSTQLAIVAEDYQSHQRSVTVCDLNGACRSTKLPTGTTDVDDRFDLQWNDERVIVTLSKEIERSNRVAALSTTWAFRPGDARVLVSTTSRDVRLTAAVTDGDWQSKIQALGGDAAAGLLDQVQKVGGVDVDFWCSDCAFAKLRRSTPH